LIDLSSPPSCALPFPSVIGSVKSTWGRGVMKNAVARVMRHAQDQLGATAFFAGVSNRNHKSVALLRELGYELAIEHANYNVFTRLRD